MLPILILFLKEIKMKFTDFQQEYCALPENRKAIVDESLKTLLTCKSVKNYDVQKHIQESQNKTVFNYDIKNLKNSVTNKVSPAKDSCEVQCFIEKIKNDGGHVKFGKEEDGSFTYLAYSTHQMKKLLCMYPECLILDTTYETNVYSFPLTTIMCIDSEGSGHPVMHAFLQQENSDVMEKCLQFLKDLYDSSLTSSFFVDKEFAEISALSTLFPHSSVSLCIWHNKIAVKESLQSKGLPQHLVTYILDLFMKQQLAVTEREFNQLQNLIKDVASSQIIKYFEENWWNNSKNWASYKSLHVPKLMLATTGHLECYHSKIKPLLNSKLLLYQCLTYLHDYDQQLFNQSMMRDTFNSMREHYNTADTDPVIKQICNDLSSFAAKYVCKQYNMAKEIHYEIESLSESRYKVFYKTDSYHTVMVSSDVTECSCKSFVNMNLSCRHIFFIKIKLNKQAYESVGREHRFSLFYNIQPSIKCSQDTVVIQQEKFLLANKLMDQFINKSII